MDYGLIGKTLAHSFSKEIHEQLADYDYSLTELSEAELDGFMRKAEFKAINVTIPYKEKVIPYLYEISPEAKAIGAVNTIVNRGGRLYGYNTDFFGLKSLIERNGISLFEKKVLILGTGGTSRTACAVAKSMGAAEVFTVSRSEKEGALGYEEAYTVAADAVINTTPCGMFPNSSAVPIDIEGFESLSGVVDVIYNPLRTGLVLAAKSKGIPSSGGLYMLVAQAFYACELFTGKKLNPASMDGIYKRVLRSKENLVLIGMPGCGKTTIGKALAEKTGKRFIDLDDEISREYSLTPAKIIEEFGEDEFRRREALIVKKNADITGAVIATGGGCVLRRENTEALSRNGKLVFINRSIEEIIPTEDRPLSKNRELLEKRYRERYPVYSAAADITVIPSADKDENADAVIRKINEVRE